MLIIEEQNVYLTRGDDATLEFELTLEDGEAYEMAADDQLFFTVRELPSRESEALVSVPGAPGSNVIVLRHADTVALEVGRYSADCQLVTAQGRIHTVWPKPEGSGRYRERNFKNFVLMPEVTIP